jgi:diadenylate cyclase
MRDEKMEDMLLKVLRSVAPGRPLREGLENVLRAKNGGLIVLAENPEVMGIVEGGFMLNADYSPSHLYELAKMDGAIILSKDAKKILAANTQMVPSQDIPSSETGIRHRTAERVARQTGTLVIAISQRRGVITLYKGTLKYVLQDLGLILTKANQAIQTLEKYRVVLDKFLLSLSVMEFQESVTPSIYQ